MDVTKETVQKDLDELEVWYADKLAEIKHALLDPVRQEIKRKNKAARDKYLAQRGRLRKLLDAVANQPIVVSDPVEEGEPSDA